MTKLTVKNRVLLGISDSQLPFLSLQYHYLCLLLVVFLTQMCDVCKGSILLTLRVSKVKPIFNLMNFLILLRQGIWYCLLTFGAVNIWVAEQPGFLAKKTLKCFILWHFSLPLYFVYTWYILCNKRLMNIYSRRPVSITDMTEF